MKHDIFLKKYFTFIFSLILLFTTVSSALPINGEEALYDKVLRLHVIANSDNDSDQALKLEVRNSVLYELDKIYQSENISDINGAKEAIKKHEKALVDSAKRVIFENGFDYNVSLDLCKEYYPTKKYEDITLPAGKYDSLKINIGKAEGKNWWCVLFPSLCLSVCEKKEANTYIYSENGEEFISAGFTPSEIKIITESDSDDVKVKFKVLEIFGSLFEKEAPN